MNDLYRLTAEETVETKILARTMRDLALKYLKEHPTEDIPAQYVLISRNCEWEESKESRFRIYVDQINALRKVENDVSLTNFYCRKLLESLKETGEIPVAIVWVGEIWWTHYQMSDEEQEKSGKELKEIVADLPRPSEDPDRREAVFVSIYFLDGFYSEIHPLIRANGSLTFEKCVGSLDEALKPKGKILFPPDF